MNSKNKVSIIIPVYNTEKYLSRCLYSVTHQKYQNLEIICVNDGSTDNSSKILDEYATKDPRIKIIYQKNQGQSSARNTGLEKATGDYISFIDSDDSVKADFITNLLTPYHEPNVAISVCGIHYKRLKKHSATDVYTNRLRPRHTSETPKAYILYLFAIDGRMYSSVNKLYKAKIAKTLKFDESLNFAEDTKFVLDYLKKAKGTIEFVLNPLYTYNFGTENSTINQTALNWQNWQTSYKYLQSWLGPHPSHSEKFWLRLVHLRWHISYIRSKKRAKS